MIGTTPPAAAIVIHGDDNRVRAAIDQKDVVATPERRAATADAIRGVRGVSKGGQGGSRQQRQPKQVQLHGSPSNGNPWV